MIGGKPANIAARCGMRLYGRSTHPKFLANLQPASAIRLDNFGILSILVPLNQYGKWNLCS